MKIISILFLVLFSGQLLATDKEQEFIQMRVTYCESHKIFTDNCFIALEGLVSIYRNIIRKNPNATNIRIKLMANLNELGFWIGIRKIRVMDYYFNSPGTEFLRDINLQRDITDLANQQFKATISQAMTIFHQYRGKLNKKVPQQAYEYFLIATERIFSSTFNMLFLNTIMDDNHLSRQTRQEIWMKFLRTENNKYHLIRNHFQINTINQESLALEDKNFLWPLRLEHFYGDLSHMIRQASRIHRGFVVIGVKYNLLKTIDYSLCNRYENIREEKLKSHIQIEDLRNYILKVLPLIKMNSLETRIAKSLVAHFKARVDILNEIATSSAKLLKAMQPHMNDDIKVSSVCKRGPREDQKLFPK